MKITIDKSGAVELFDELLDEHGKPKLDAAGAPQARAWSFKSLDEAVRQAAEFPAAVRDQVLAAALELKKKS